MKKGVPIAQEMAKNKEAYPVWGEVALLANVYEALRAAWFDPFRRPTLSRLKLPGPLHFDNQSYLVGVIRKMGDLPWEMVLFPILGHPTDGEVQEKLLAAAQLLRKTGVDLTSLRREVEAALREVGA